MGGRDHARNVRRGTPVVLSIILILSIVTFGLTVTYAKQASESPVKVPSTADPWELSRYADPTTAWIIFYSTTMSFISIIHSLVHLAMFYLSTLVPAWTLSAAFILFGGWITQVSIWMSCTGAPDYDPEGMCFQGKLVSDEYGFLPVYVNSRIANVFLVFGWVLAATYLILIVFACIEVHKERMARKHPEKVGMVRLNAPADDSSGEQGSLESRKAKSIGISGERINGEPKCGSIDILMEAEQGR